MSEKLFTCEFCGKPAPRAHWFTGPRAAQYMQLDDSTIRKVIKRGNIRVLYHRNGDGYDIPLCEMIKYMAYEREHLWTKGVKAKRFTEEEIAKAKEKHQALMVTHRAAKRKEYNARRKKMRELAKTGKLIRRVITDLNGKKMSKVLGVLQDPAKEKMTNREIAQKIGVSYETVRRGRERILMASEVEE